MNIILGLTAFLIPSLGMAAGLSIAYTVSLFFIALIANQSIMSVKHELSRAWLANARWLKFVASALILWCALSCFWSPDILKSIQTLLMVLFFISMGLAARPLQKEKSALIQRAFFWGFAISIILFIIEYKADGVLSKTFRSIFQPNKVSFALYMLDRGCSFLSLSAWVVIGSLLRRDKNIEAFLVYLLILGLLFISDSLASFVGFSLGAITFGLLSISKRSVILIIAGILAYCIAMPIVSQRIDPMKIATEVDLLPSSSKHRIFIWNFTANKSLEEKVSGHGFDSSRHIGQHDKVIYGNESMPLLPLHPHNSVMQILLETGWIGLVLYALLISSILMTIVRCSKNMVSAACFINYLFIGMVSFGMWQIWWVASAAFIFSMIKILIEAEKPDA